MAQLTVEFPLDYPCISKTLAVDLNLTTKQAVQFIAEKTNTIPLRTGTEGIYLKDHNIWLEDDTKLSENIDLIRTCVCQKSPFFPVFAHFSFRMSLHTRKSFQILPQVWLLPPLFHFSELIYLRRSPSSCGQSSKIQTFLKFLIFPTS